MSLALLLVALAVAPGAAEAPKLTEQQQRLKECNAQANRQKLVGEARMDFMSSCQRSHGDGPRVFSAQREKMRRDREERLSGDTAAAGGRR